MAQERFEIAAAERAVNLYKSFLTHPELKKKIGNSNRTLVVLSIISYFGTCYKAKLQKAVPVAGLDILLNELLTLGYIKKKKDGKSVMYLIEHHPDFTRANVTLTREQYFLFANVLMNVSTYIRAYKMTSWNVFSFMLEIATKFDGEKVNLSEKSIESIHGFYANKINTRKQLETMGIIKSLSTKRTGPHFTGNYSVNKEAFIIGIK